MSTVIDPIAIGERLAYCRKNHKLSIREVSEKSGVNNLTIAKYERGGMNIEAKNSGVLMSLLILADFYGVSIDWLLGRCEMDERIYKMDVDNLYLRSYEKYLIHNKRVCSLASQSGELPTLTAIAPGWPYTLIDAINGGDELIPVPISEEIQKNLEWVISERLTEREQEVIRYIYKDLMTLEEVGDKFDVGKERIRQIAKKAIRKLKYKGCIMYILLGKELAESDGDLIAMRAKVSERLVEIKKLEMVKKELDEKGPESQYYKDNIDEHVHIGGLSEIDFLNLSVRSYNCLKRAGLHDVNKVRAAIISGDILKVRNLGKRSIAEIIYKLEVYSRPFDADEITAFDSYVRAAYMEAMQKYRSASVAEKGAI